MIVKLLRPWNHWDAGCVLATLQASVAKVLIERGVGVEIVSSNEDVTIKAPITRPAMAESITTTKSGRK